MRGFSVAPFYIKTLNVWVETGPKPLQSWQEWPSRKHRANPGVLGNGKIWIKQFRKNNLQSRWIFSAVISFKLKQFGFFFFFFSFYKNRKKCYLVWANWVSREVFFNTSGNSSLSPNIRYKPAVTQNVGPNRRQYAHITSIQLMRS